MKIQFPVVHKSNNIQEVGSILRSEPSEMHKIESSLEIIAILTVESRRSVRNISSMYLQTCLQANTITIWMTRDIDQGLLAVMLTIKIVEIKIVMAMLGEKFLIR